MKQYVVFFMLLISCLKIHAQDKQTYLDSLWTIWKDKTQSDTARLIAMHRFAWDAYIPSQPDSAFYYAQMEFDFAKAKGLKKYMPSALNTMGTSFSIKGDYTKSIAYTLSAVEILQEIGDKKKIAGALGNIGYNYERKGDYPMALDYFQKSLKIDQENGDNIGIASSLMSIGSIYQSQGDYPKALDYTQRSLKIMEESGDKRGLASAMINIGVILKQQNNYPKALDYYQQALMISRELEDEQGISICLSNIGNIYKNQGDYPKALEYNQKSLKISEIIGDKEGVAISLITIGEVYQLQGDYRKAINQCQKGFELAQEIEALKRQREACKCLYNGYKVLGNGNMALKYHEQMLALADSLQGEETGKKLQQMEFHKQVFKDSMATAEKERLMVAAHREEVLKKNNTRNLIAAGGIIALLLAAGFFTRWRYVNKSKAIIEKEKDRSNSLLLNILPADIAEELKIHGKAEARDFDLASILFTDFKGFTEQSAKLTAADLVSEINHCFEAFDGIMETYGIEKIKTIGDAYMAAGGLPVPTDDAVRKTILAAIEIQAFMTKRYQQQKSQGLPAFEMRAGIHTGPVVAGIVGVKKFQYDIWGDTVNTAARMESASEVGKVNISQDTFELIKDDPAFSFEHRGKIQAKGKGEVDMYFVYFKKSF